ncbi:PssD/Cps14F family polysaccharide biosynthesis glycosyltransferase [Pedobacter arcticus]|uniref:PssD/Cps14F family polysaccharide biosynthesis glycosyltransferase n=1 Tax=Pedobacter arcticus TaxID=752140 RepID=UPI0002FC1358|nr:PssD/Cps14F family polysaccharide biosynthesis glycosyltransferase [Pedobacter arcticus]
MEKDKRKKIILICSDGGHLAQTLHLKKMFLKYNYLLVTEKTPATASLEETYNTFFLAARSKGQGRGISFYLVALYNAFLSLKILLTHYPKVIISTGSHTAIPMCFLGKLLGIKVVFILSYARVKSRAKSADLMYKIADKFIIQWPDEALNYKKGIYLGGIY